MTVLGIDSRYNTRTPPPQYKYVYHKLTEHRSFVNEIADEQQAMAIAANLPMGWYHFWRAWADPVEQIKWLSDNEFNRPQTQLRTVLDFEDTYAPKGGATPGLVMKAIEAFEYVYGYKPIIYSAPWWWNVWVGSVISVEKINARPLWPAHWTAASAPTLATNWKNWVLWQYAGDLSLTGFNAKVDLNRMKQEWYDQETAPPPPPPDDPTVVHLPAGTTRILIEIGS